MEHWNEAKVRKQLHKGIQKTKRIRQERNVIDDVHDVLGQAYRVEASREDLAEAIGEALDILDDYDYERQVPR